MSDGSAATFGTVAFGDLEAGIWGVAWVGQTTLVAVGMLEPGAASKFVPASGPGIDAVSHPTAGWSATADGVEVTVTPLGDEVDLADGHGFDQLCRVQGRLVLGAAEHDIDALGVRTVRRDVALGQLESLRDVSAWFPPADALVLTALRPRKAKGHAGDVVAASVFDASGAVAVADPRLSTTYAADGSPMRLGLELWLNVSEESDEQYPRRAAGEALGLSAASTDNGVEIAAHAFRCHSKGSDGIGVYLLARPR